MISDFKDLVAWQLARKLVKEVYILTRTFPKDEIFALTSQMKRSAVSIPSNIAEGFGRYTTKDYFHFLSIAIGSLLELETQIILACDLDFLKPEKFNQLNLNLIELKKVLFSLRKSLKPK